MKKVKNPFDWYPRDYWWWPDHDEKLLQVIDWVHDLDQVLPLIPNKRVCIQAGGATGVWPCYLSLRFGRVITFEPQMENFSCLMESMVARPNITAYRAALGAKSGYADVVLDFESESGNCGAYHLAEGSEVNITTIDGFVLSECDFICLDVEGFEHQAILGARETIDRCNPVVMVEEKPLPHLNPGEHLEARKYLESIGYKEVLKVHRDAVFKRD